LFRVERLVGSLRSWGGRVLLGNGSLHEGEGEVVVIDLLELNGLGRVFLFAVLSY
jgi:hypothetical protein